MDSLDLLIKVMALFVLISCVWVLILLVLKNNKGLNLIRENINLSFKAMDDAILDTSRRLTIVETRLEERSRGPDSRDFFDALYKQMSKPTTQPTQNTQVYDPPKRKPGRPFKNVENKNPQS